MRVSDQKICVILWRRGSRIQYSRVISQMNSLRLQVKCGINACSSMDRWKLHFFMLITAMCSNGQGQPGHLKPFNTHIAYWLLIDRSGRAGQCYGGAALSVLRYRVVNVAIFFLFLVVECSVLHHLYYLCESNMKEEIIVFAQCLTLRNTSRSIGVHNLMSIIWWPKMHLRGNKLSRTLNYGTVNGAPHHIVDTKLTGDLHKNLLTLLFVKVKNSKIIQNNLLI